jgi:hypothetical protein
MSPELEKKLSELLANGLTYTAVFVPQSASRNSAEDRPSLNWRVALTRAKLDNGHGKPQPSPSGTLATDYMQGIGHVPGYIHAYRGSIEVMNTKKEQERAAETGKYPHPKRKLGTLGYHELLSLPAPPLADILYSLLLDSEAADESFEDWCANFGYDSDSIAAAILARRTR